MGGRVDYARWREEIGRSRATLALIEACVAPSPRQRAWAARTLSGLARMVRHYERDLCKRGVPQRRRGEWR